MSRKRKPNEVVNFFKEKFDVTFVHKPSMEAENTFYYFILEDKVRVRLKQFGTILAIDEVVPMTSEYINSFYDKFLKTLIEQDKFTILISALGNTHALDSAMVAIDAPIVEDKRFITVPETYYDRMKDYYKDDVSKYGFYLLAVNEEAVETEQEPKPTANEILDNMPEPVLTPVKVGVMPLMMRFEEMLKSKYGEITKNEIDPLHLVNFTILDISFQVKIPITENRIDICSFSLGKEYRYTDLVQLMTSFVNFLSECPDIYIPSVGSSQVDQVCSFLGFAPQKPNLEDNRAWNTIGSYKVTSIS